MSVSLADFNRGLVTLWNSTGLNNAFKAFWSGASLTEFKALEDQEARPGQPWPYCVVMINTPSTITRMSGRETAKQRFETRELDVEFRVHAREMTGIDKSAKTIASELVEEILKVFGGHPTEEPQTVEMTHGAVLQATYLNDVALRDGDNEYHWIVRYQFTLDVPVAA